jgi:SAM-dependent methyltransferase
MTASHPNQTSLSPSAITSEAGSLPSAVAANRLAAAEFTRPASRGLRWYGALTRRFRRMAQELDPRQSPVPRSKAAELALQWLISQAGCGYLSMVEHGRVASVAVTADCLATLANYGQDQSLRRCAGWLLALQRADGSFPNDRLKGSSLYNTARSAIGMRRVAATLDPASREQVRRAVRSATTWIARRIDTAGRIDISDHPPDSLERRGPRVLLLRGLVPLVLSVANESQDPSADMSGDIFRVRGEVPSRELVELPVPPQAAYKARRALERALRQMQCSGHMRPVDGPLSWTTFTIEALIDLGQPALAAELWDVAFVRWKQGGRAPSENYFASNTANKADDKSTDGMEFPNAATSVPEAGGPFQRIDISAVDGTALENDGTLGLSQLASLGYRLQRRPMADSLLEQLARRQRSDGAFSNAGAFWPMSRRDPCATWTVKHFLDAQRLQVATAFQSDCTTVPEAIDPQDPRVRALRRWFDTVQAQQPGRRLHVADLGCGQGRYLRLLRQWYPQHRYVGIDPSAALLDGLSDGIQRRQGSLLRLPADNGEFDVTLAIESLEHALVLPQAVAELCRTTRPGGHLLVIDKLEQYQRISQHEPWERWLEPDAFRTMLAPAFDQISLAGITSPEDATSRRYRVFACCTARRAQR